MKSLLVALAAVFLCRQPVGVDVREPGTPPLLRVDDGDVRPSVKAVCAALFKRMNEKREGIFHEDISAATLVLSHKIGDSTDWMP